jgi:hypothetical protein
MRSEADDSDAATQKLDALGTSDRQGASGGLSAQDLLRREGRL